MSRLLVLVLSTIWAQALTAQTIVRPPPALDAGRIALRDELLRFRDTLNTIDAAAARLQRDYRHASTAALTSRARVMADACARSVRNVTRARRAVLAADTSNPRRVKRRGEMVQALDLLRVALTRCEADFGAFSRPGEGEQIRGYANDRAVRVLASLRQYERVLATFFQTMGIRVSPLGTQPQPLAG
jgi:hypothetical protein